MNGIKRFLCTVLLLSTGSALVFSEHVNFHELSLNVGINSRSILRLREAGSNIPVSKANRIMEGLFSKDPEVFGSYRLRLGWEYAGSGPNDEAVMGWAIGIYSIFISLPLLFGAPCFEYKYSLSATLSIFDNTNKLVQEFRSSTSLVSLEGMYNKNYTKKASEPYSRLIYDCLLAATEHSEEINAALKKAKYPTDNFSLDSAVASAYKKLASGVPRNSRVAVVTVAAQDTNQGNLALNRLTASFVDNRNCIVVDRRNIDIVLQELGFQKTSLVDKSSALEAGKLLGAEIVILGSIDVYNNQNLIAMQALSVKTGQVVAMATETFR
jgi:hypothetical protein